MIIIKISKKGYTPTTFYVFGDNVYADNKEIGFFKHNFSYNDLLAFCEKMKKDGFKITVKKSWELA